MGVIDEGAEVVEGVAVIEPEEKVVEAEGFGLLEFFDGGFAVDGFAVVEGAEVEGDTPFIEDTGGGWGVLVVCIWR